MHSLFQRHAFHWTKKAFLISIVSGVLLLIGSLIINFFAGTYASTHASGAVTDLILSNIPVLNVDVFFVEGSYALIILITLLCAWEPKRLPFALKSIALFVLVRSFFVILTHIGPFSFESPVDPSRFFDKFNFTGDLFFSGHVGLPFLMTLLFWNIKVWRWTFLVLTFAFAAIVLLGHLHYSIDVFGAFFITFTIYHLAQYLFPKDFLVFEHGAL